MGVKLRTEPHCEGVQVVRVLLASREALVHPELREGGVLRLHDGFTANVQENAVVRPECGRVLTKRDRSLGVRQSLGLSRSRESQENEREHDILHYPLLEPTLGSNLSATIARK